MISFNPTYVLVDFSGNFITKRKKNESDEDFLKREFQDVRAPDVNKGYLESCYHFIIPSIGQTYLRGRKLTWNGWNHPGKNLECWCVLIVGEPPMSGDQEAMLKEIMKKEFPEGTQYKLNIKTEELK